MGRALEIGKISLLFKTMSIPVKKASGTKAWVDIFFNYKGKKFAITYIETVTRDTINSPAFSNTLAHLSANNTLWIVVLKNSIGLSDIIGKYQHETAEVRVSKNYGYKLMKMRDIIEFYGEVMETNSVDIVNLINEKNDQKS